MVRIRQTSGGNDMSSSHANRYTPESEQRAVQLYESKSPCTYAEVARELGIDAGTLSKWVAQARPGEDADGSDNPFQMADDLRRLRRENERLRRENEILSRASAFFASRQPWATPRGGPPGAHGGLGQADPVQRLLARHERRARELARAEEAEARARPQDVVQGHAPGHEGRRRRPRRRGVEVHALGPARRQALPETEEEQVSGQARPPLLLRRGRRPPPGSRKASRPRAGGTHVRCYHERRAGVTEADRRPEGVIHGHLHNSGTSQATREA